MERWEKPAEGDKTPMEVRCDLAGSGGACLELEIKNEEKKSHHESINMTHE
jgi:hypothetical protein